jgi:uncharacterized membrane protein
MVVLVVLVTALLVARCVGAAGVEFLDSWPAATRMGLGIMLLVTASAHFTPMRHDLARMMPTGIPRPMLLVYFTGMCELLGAVGLQLPSTRFAAALALILFFIAVLSANIHAAKAGVTLRGKPATPLALRIPMQALFIALTGWAGVYSPV